MLGLLSNPLALLIAAAVIFAAGFGSGFGLEAKLKGTEIAEIKAANAKADADASKAALKDLETASAAIKTAATNYQTTQSNLGSKLDLIRKDIKNVKPLPADCRPDDLRMRKLSDAIDTANKATARQ